MEENRILSSIGDYRLWVIAVVTVALMTFYLTFMVPPRQIITSRVVDERGNEILSGSESIFVSAEEIFGSIKRGEYIFVGHLPFLGGVTIGKRSTFSGISGLDRQTVRANPLMGGTMILLACILAGLWTRRSENGFNAVIPFWILSMVCLVIASTQAADHAQKLVWFPVVLWSTGILFVIGFIAYGITAWATQMGWDLFAHVDEDEMSSDTTVRDAAMLNISRVAPSVATKPFKPFSPYSESKGDGDSTTEQEVVVTEASADNVIVQSGLIDKKVSFAVKCPFCGNPKINHRRPGICRLCGRNIGVMTEPANGERCPDCGGVLLAVDDVKFCHHCGKLLDEWRANQRAAKFEAEILSQRQNGHEPQ